MNNKIVSTKKTISLFLAFILLAGTIALSSSLSMRDVQAQQGYDGTYNNYENDYGKDNNSYKSKDNKIVKKVNCNNINVNANGLEQNVLPPALANLLSSGDDEDERDASSYGRYGAGEQQSGYDNNKNSFKFLCINNNNNTLIGGEEEQPIPPIPPIPPEPTSATLTVNKQVFGCNNFNPLFMGCNLQNNSPEWLDCNTNPAISGTIFCRSLPESIFDIEVLDDQNTQIQQFVGSEQGTTIQNLEPGTYTVNEIKHPTNIDELGELPTTEERCIIAGFPDGGTVVNSTANVIYTDICFEYEDEQGNDCGTITLAAGEERTCTVKNYIRGAVDR